MLQCASGPHAVLRPDWQFPEESRSGVSRPGEMLHISKAKCEDMRYFQSNAPLWQICIHSGEPIARAPKAAAKRLLLM